MFLYDMIISPIEMIIGWVFTYMNNWFGLLGTFGAIYGVSLVINFLALPIYNVAEGIQEKERKHYKTLEPVIKHIKKTFKGEEQFMMLSEYYRQNNYHPLYVLRGSLSIMIEVPFFIAAYHYLSTALLETKDSWWIFKDFGSPDALWNIELFGASFAINVLPIIMTLINFASAYFYTKDAPLRDKIQTYVIGLIFLVLLYSSPAGLVGYWILNNIFSLIKNIIVKTKHPLHITAFIVAIHVLAYGILFMMFYVNVKVLIISIILALIISIAPFVSKYIKRAGKLFERFNFELSSTREGLLVVGVSGLGLAILCGFLLPSLTMATSPIEFSNLAGEVHSPLALMPKIAFTFLGLCVLWPLVLAKMAGDKRIKYFALIMTVFFVSALVNVFALKSDYGNLSVLFFPQKISGFGGFLGGLLSLVVIIASVVGFWFISKKGKLSILLIVFASISAAEIGMGASKCIYISDIYEDYSKNLALQEKAGTDRGLEKVFKLSSKGENVVVIFLDAAINPLLPFALEEMPELHEKLSGFVYYPNTASYSAGTVTGTPVMYGGYEYTPFAINEREDELLVDKHTEALLVPVRLFSDAGWDVTITDPPWPNYTARGGLTIYDNEKNTYATELFDKYTEDYLDEMDINSSGYKLSDVQREACNFSILQALYPPLRGKFHASFRRYVEDKRLFFGSFAALYYLEEITQIEEEGNSQYIFMGNNTTHDPIYLDKDLLRPVQKNQAPKLKENFGGDANTFIRYQSLLASLKQLGKWFDYLKENDVYDNTKIIIVADHGAAANISKEVNFPRTSFMPLLMYKDFNSTGDIKTDETFMTNGDVLFLSKEGIEELSDKNPFTGKVFKEDKEEGVYTVVTYETNAEALKNRGQKQFNFETNAYAQYITPGDLKDPKNWKKY